MLHSGNESEAGWMRAVMLDRARHGTLTAIGWTAIGWTLAILAASALLGCSSVHCSTEGQGGGPGGCGLDFKFSTTDDPVMPGSPAVQPNGPGPPP
jgi:hypothetical protein